MLVGGCVGSPERDIEELVLRDSIYLDGETLELFNGRVFKFFADRPSAVQLRDTLTDGRWNGELTLYYPSGRIRYQGELFDGARYGGWIENRGEAAPEDACDQLLQEIESLAMYPVCPES